MHAIVRGTRDSTAERHLSGTIVRKEFGAKQVFDAPQHRFGAGVAAHERAAETPSAADPQQAQKRHRHAHKRVRSLQLQDLSKFSIAIPDADAQRLCLETLNGLRDQLTEPVRAGEGEADHRDAAGEDQLAQPRREQLHRALQITRGVKQPLGGSGGAAGALGDHTLHRALGEQQHTASVFCKIFCSRERQRLQIVQRTQRRRQVSVEPLPVVFFFQ